MNNSMLRTSTRVMLTIIGLGMLAAGCGGSQYAIVSGKVTRGGKPLSQGLITFRPKPETPAPDFSADVASGEYRVPKGVVPGDYVVDVRSWQKTGRQVKGPFGDMTEEIVNVIPKAYWGDDTQLSVQLKPGSNTANFELQN